MTAIASVFWGVVTLSVLVFIHEAGHYLAARLFGLKVHEFMIGLPGPKISRVIGETRYGVTAIPLGGYVKIAGMAGDAADPLLEPVLGAVVATGPMSVEELRERFPEAGDDLDIVLMTLQDWGAVSISADTDGLSTVTSSIEPHAAETPGALLAKAQERTYQALPTWKRLVVLLSGVAVNLVAALAVFTIVLASTGFVHDTGTVDPLAGGPAAKAGLLRGDAITAVDDTSVDGFVELVETLATYEPGTEITLEVERGGEPFTVTLTLGTNPDTGMGFAGVGAVTENRPLPLGQAALMAFVFLGATAQALLGFFNPATAAVSLESSSSIVGISVFAAEAASSGLADYLMLLASISLSLGLINLLPIPPLDGGRVVVELVQRVIGRPLSPVLTGMVTFAGMFLLIGLMVFLLFNDVSRLAGG